MSIAPIVQIVSERASARWAEVEREREREREKAYIFRARHSRRRSPNTKLNIHRKRVSGITGESSVDMTEGEDPCGSHILQVLVV